MKRFHIEHYITMLLRLYNQNIETVLETLYFTNSKRRNAPLTFIRRKLGYETYLTNAYFSKRSCDELIGLGKESDHIGFFARKEAFSCAAGLLKGNTAHRCTGFFLDFAFIFT